MKGGVRCTHCGQTSRNDQGRFNVPPTTFGWCCTYNGYRSEHETCHEFVISIACSRINNLHNRGIFVEDLVLESTRKDVRKERGKEGRLSKLCISWYVPSSLPLDVPLCADQTRLAIWRRGIESPVKTGWNSAPTFRGTPLFKTAWGYPHVLFSSLLLLLLIFFIFSSKQFFIHSLSPTSPQRFRYRKEPARFFLLSGSSFAYRLPLGKRSLASS